MPKEVTDIKSFIEICRRKDASCTSVLQQEKGERNNPGAIGHRCATGANDLTYSGADKEEQEDRWISADEIQGPVPSSPLHPRAQGFGQGGEAEAESATRYVIPKATDGSGGVLTAGVL